MNVLSLFDGMSCGQQAIERCGFKVDKYFASEIDKYAIKVTMANYPDTVQLGSVVDIDGYKLPKIDLLMGGSPCQSFSFAGKRKGMATKCETEILTLEHYLQLKADGFEFEGQSYLFWEYMRLLNEVKPKYFLLENVEMGEKWERILSKAIGVNGIHINSSLVSAQNRKRIYWTNIGMESSGLFGDMQSIIKQPKDKGILLKDVLESDVDKKYFLSDTMINSFNIKTKKYNDSGGGFCFKPTEGNNKGRTITNPGKNRMDDNFIIHNTMPRSSTTGKGDTGHLSREDGKTYCLDTGNTNAVEFRNISTIRKIIKYDIPEIVSFRKYELDIPKFQYTLKEYRCKTNKEVAEALQVPKTMVEHWFRTDNYFSIPDRNIWFKLKELLKIETNEFDQAIIEFEERESVFDKTNRVYDEDGIAPTITSTSADERIITNSGIRRLTPIECERLQTVKDNYTNHVSDSQRYKMLGNGWTIDVICHILNYIK